MARVEVIVAFGERAAIIYQHEARVAESEIPLSTAWDAFLMSAADRGAQEAVLGPRAPVSGAKEAAKYGPASGGMGLGYLDSTNVRR